MDLTTAIICSTFVLLLQNKNKNFIIMLIQNVSITDQVMSLIKEITSSQGGQWVEKKKLRSQEASKISKMDFNPKASRTRSF